MTHIKEYKICTFCVMDTSEPDIVFDEHGRCNHCKRMQENFAHYTQKDKKLPDLDKYIAEIKARGKNRKYDSIVGISGGVDSSYTAYMAKKLGLRPLLFHLDNGWGAREAVQNIHAIVKYTGFDYVSKVLDWNEFRNLQIAYLKSSVIDVETLTDHAVYAATFKMAAKHKIPTIVTGENTATEAILPASWHYGNKLTDSVNIKNIFSQYFDQKITDFPLLSYERFLYYTKVLKISFFPILNYLDYNKEEVIKTIKSEMGWQEYGGKHYESVFTRFYQGYILPMKFGIDKRRAHLSTLISSGQMSRDNALEVLKTPPLDPEVLKYDLEFVPKKLGLSSQEFSDIMNLPIKKHTDYKTDSYKRGNLSKLKSLLKK